MDLTIFNNITNIISNEFLSGVKIPHRISQPLIRKENGIYVISVFAFFYDRAGIQDGMIERPALWAIADIDSGHIIEQYDCKHKDFSNASFDKKYSIKPTQKVNITNDYFTNAFELFEKVRQGIVKNNCFNEALYKQYLEMVINTIPEDYKQFYYDLSI